MSKQFDEFKQIIREFSYDNTYKVAWAKALVELSSELPIAGDEVEITLEQIARKYLKYYWNQTIFFDLIQGSNLQKPPEVVTTIKTLIDAYYENVGNRKPELFERAESNLPKREYEAALRKTTSTLKKDVSYRFLNLNGKKLNVYRYNKGDNSLQISTGLLQELRDNERDLYDLINYRWGMILETFNSSPRINKKVKIMDEREIKRKPLTKYKQWLDIENPSHICFLCGQEITDKELSIDHVIPWSYMYSDDLWNLVYVHRGCNSSKSNVVPSEEGIAKLKERNKRLLDDFIKEHISEKKALPKEIGSLEIAIENDYVDKFYTGCK